MQFKKPFILLFFMLLIKQSQGQDLISEMELARTFSIRKDSSLGTTFMVYAGNKNYMVTAKHVLGSVKNGQNIQYFLLKNNAWHKQDGKVFIHQNLNVDVALIQPDDTATVTALSLNQVNLVLGDEGFFLGFPFGLGTFDNNLNGGFPFALVKKCVFSGALSSKGIDVFFFDGNNNPGFSGGPIFFKNRFNPSDKKLYLTGIVSGYIPQTSHEKTPLGIVDYNENSGIIIAYSSSYIKEILNQNGF